MADILALTATVVGTTGGESAVNRAWSVSDYSVKGLNETSFMLPTASNRFLAVDGSDISGQSNPIMPGFAEFNGIALVSAQDLELTLDGAAAPITILGGKPAILPVKFSTALLENNSAQSSLVKLIWWGADI